MKRIGCTRIPYPEQMLAMASNLQEKFNVSALVEISAWNFIHADSSRNPQLRYKIYLGIDHKPAIEFSTWSKALSFYRELMKGDEDTWKEAKVV